MTTHSTSLEIATDRGRTRHIFPFGGRIIVAPTVLAVSILLIGIFYYGVYTQILPYQHEVRAVGGLPAPVVATSTKSMPMREVHIANNGLMLLRGATVTSLSGSTIHISMSWGGTDFKWAINTTSATKFLTSGGEKGTRADIQVGDTIGVTGMISSGGSEPTIDAAFVRG